MAVKPLGEADLCRKTDAAALGFESTAALPESDGPVGQERALRALTFGASMAQKGYNIFVSGPAGSGKHSSVRQVLEKLAAAMPPPPDWVYVHNFDRPHKPLALRLPAGEGRAFKSGLADLISGLLPAMSEVLEGEDYRKQRGEIEARFRSAVDGALARMRDRAAAQGMALVERREGGLGFVPQRDGLPLSDDEYRNLPREERAALGEKTRALQADLEKVFSELNSLYARAIEQIRSLEKNLGEAELRRLMRPLSDRFRDVPAVQAHVEAVFQDLVEHMEPLQAAAQGLTDEEGNSPAREIPFHRYEVNLIVDNAGTRAAPVITLRLPSLSQLVGKVEHVPVLMTTITDYMYIRPGALHRANGGFLLIDALELLQHDVSWEALKRTLREGSIRIENLAEVLDRNPMLTIQPEPVPLEARIVLFGEPWLYYRLRELDPDFAELFKVQADFSTTAPRTAKNAEALLRVAATVARRDGLRPLDRSGAARLLDQAARMAGDAEKLSVRTGALSDLVREADLFARDAGRAQISGSEIEAAVAAQEDRAGRLKALQQELITRQVLLVDTEGEKIGQINGLTVASLGGFAFGMPARITARVRPGDGAVTDIERLADFSGPTHAKGVQIISGYLNGQYSGRGKLSISASLAFEQSYGPIDGDSASVAELVAILSAAGEVPVRQSIAVTGSINQHGRVQPIGGVNEKIEGFFEICRLRGAGKGQGVIIPRANLANLMLRDSVLDAVRRGQFSVWAVETVDEAIEILTGMKAGVASRSGQFPRGTFNARVAERLIWFARPRVLKPIQLDRWWPF